MKYLLDTHVFLWYLLGDAPNNVAQMLKLRCIYLNGDIALSTSA